MSDAYPKSLLLLNSIVANEHIKKFKPTSVLLILIFSIRKIFQKTHAVKETIKIFAIPNDTNIFLVIA